MVKNRRISVTCRAISSSLTYGTIASDGKAVGDIKILE